MNPFVPAVGGFVLPPPTSKCIRALKAANFIAAEEATLPSTSRSLLDHNEDRPSYISSHSLSQSVGDNRSASTGSVIKHESSEESRQHRNQLTTLSSANAKNATATGTNEQGFHTHRDTLLANEPQDGLSCSPSSKVDDAEQSSDENSPNVQPGQTSCSWEGEKSEKDSQQEFADVTDNLNHVDDPDLLRFEMLTVGRSHLAQLRRTQSDPTGVVVLRPVHSGESTIDLGRDVRVACHFSSEYLERNEGYAEEPAQECASGTPEIQRSNAGSCHSEPPASSAVLKKPFAGPISNAEPAVKGLLDEVEAITAPSTSGQETIDDKAQQLLSDRAYLDEIPRISLSAVKSHTVEKTTPSLSTVSDHASLHSWRADDLDAPNAEHRRSSAVHREVLTLAPREPASPTPGRFPIDSPNEEEISRIQPHKCRPIDHNDSVTCSRISYERYPIDGLEAPAVPGRTSELARRKETQANQLIQRGRSFLQHMPRIFRKDRGRKHTNQQGRPLSQEASSSIGGLFRRKSSKAGWCSTVGGDSPPKSGPNHTIPAYSFDGACDEDDTLSTMPAIDLNKALPPQPLLTKNKTTASCRTDTPSLTHSHESKARPSTASTQLSELSRVSSKKHFHRTAHELIHPDMGGSREPSPLRQVDSDRLLIPPKYDPLASPKQPDT